MKRAVVATFGLVLVAVLIVLAPVASHHLLPLPWTGEARRLADVIEAREGSRIAEIGAGGGAMAREIAAIVGRQGVVFATEISADLRGSLEEMSRSRNLPQIKLLFDAMSLARLRRESRHHLPAVSSAPAMRDHSASSESVATS